jgi:Ca2+-binding RTX toxin-like protein
MANTFRYTLGGSYDQANSRAVQTSITSDTSRSYYLNQFNNSFIVNDDLEHGDYLRDVLTGNTINPGSGVYANFSENTASVTLNGGYVGDVLIGGAANDTLNGGAGDDVLEGGAGADIFNGGDGNDTVSYAHSTAAVQPGDVFGSGGDALDDQYTSVEILRGSDFNDSFYLGGNWIIEGGAGADSIIAGAQSTASYAHSAAGVHVDLSAKTGNTGGDAQGDTLFFFTRVIGSTHADTLIAANSSSYLNGNGGLDTITGDAGNDTIAVTGAWASVDGGAGTDRLIVRSAGGFDMIVPEAGAIANVEKIIVANNAILDLSLQSDSVGAIKLNSREGGFAAVAGTSGNDRIHGGLGDDIMTGGLGRDHLTGAGGADLFVFRESSGARDVITDFSGHDGEGDRIDFSSLGGLTLVDRFSGDGFGEVRTTTSEAGFQFVLVDADGNGAADLSIRVDTADPLTAGDFLFGKAPPPEKVAPDVATEHLGHHAFVEALHPFDGAALV